MADFLTRLAERTLGVVPVAQPIIAPIFAQGPMMPPPLVTEAFVAQDETEDATPSAAFGQSAPLVAPQSRRGAALPPDRPAPRSLPRANAPSQIAMPPTPATPAMHLPAYQVASPRQYDGEQQQPMIDPSLPTTETPAIHLSVHQAASPAQNDVEYRQHGIARSSQEHEFSFPTAQASINDGTPRAQDPHAALPHMDVPSASMPSTYQQAHRASAIPLFTATQDGEELPSEAFFSESNTDAALGQRTSAYEPREAPFPSSRPAHMQAVSPDVVQEASTREGRVIEPSPLPVPHVSWQQTQAASASLPANVQSGDVSENRSGVTTSSAQPFAVPQPALLAATQDVSDTPTIHITIGRIDVRAIIPSTPVPRPSPPRSGPTLSLEDYTRQGKGGVR